MESKFLIIDGNSIACRAATACFDMENDLKTTSGHPTGATYRFFNMFNSILNIVKPTHLIVCFDTSRHTFRNDLYPQYKANRKGNSLSNSPYIQFNDIKEILKLIGIKTDNIAGFEGDDIVGTYCKNSKANKNFILSGDKDTFQLIDKNTRVIFPIKGFNEMKIYDEKSFQDKFKISVDKYLFYKMLIGDVGDNIPGINKCGDNTAVSIINKFGSLEILKQQKDDFKNEDKSIRGWKTLKNNIEEWLPNSDLYKTLVTIKCDVNVNYDFKDCKINKINWNNAKDKFKELEFKSFIDRINRNGWYN